MGCAGRAVLADAVPVRPSPVIATTAAATPATRPSLLLMFIFAPFSLWVLPPGTEGSDWVVIHLNCEGSGMFSEAIADPAEVPSRPGGEQGRRRSDAPDQGRGASILERRRP